MGLYFVLKLANEEEQTKKGDAIALAIQTGNWFSDTLDNALLPLFTLSQFVQQLEMFHTLPEEVGAAFGSGSMPFLPPNKDGEFTHRNITGTSCTDPEKIARFEQIAAGIKRDAKMQGVLVNLQVAPLAMVCYAYPIVNTEDFEPPKLLNSTQIIGLDNLSDPSRVSAAEETIATSDEVVIAGPLSLRQCPDCDATVKTAFIAWLTIDALTDDQIIKAKGSYHKKWGFATAIINWAELVDRSDINGLFADKGVHYQLTRTDRTYNQETNQIDVKVSILRSAESNANRIKLFRFLFHSRSLRGLSQNR